MDARLENTGQTAETTATGLLPISRRAEAPGLHRRVGARVARVDGLDGRADGCLISVGLRPCYGPIPQLLQRGSLARYNPTEEGAGRGHVHSQGLHPLRRLGGRRVAAEEQAAQRDVQEAVLLFFLAPETEIGLLTRRRFRRVRAVVARAHGQRRRRATKRARKGARAAVAGLDRPREAEDAHGALRGVCGVHAAVLLRERKVREDAGADAASVFNIASMASS